MTGWTEYTLALVLFIGSHLLPRLGGLRERLMAMIGRGPYLAGYGLLSLALLVWVISAAIRAPHVELWPQAGWTRWAPNLAMPLAFVLVTCGAGLRQPFTLGGKRGADFAARTPGFAAVSRHPLFLALALWSGAHLLPNGDLAQVILFGAFAIMALAAIPAFDARARRCLGADTGAFFAATAVLSPAPLLRRDWLRANGRRMGLRALVGLALWLGSLHLHSLLIGASPFPA